MLNTPSDLATSLFEDEGHKQLAVGGSNIVNNQKTNEQNSNKNIFIFSYLLRH